MTTIDRSSCPICSITFTHIGGCCTPCHENIYNVSVALGREMSTVCPVCLTEERNPAKSSICNTRCCNNKVLFYARLYYPDEHFEHIYDLTPYMYNVCLREIWEEPIWIQTRDSIISGEDSQAPEPNECTCSVKMPHVPYGIHCRLPI